jgi:hypothetical protein
VLHEHPPRFGDGSALGSLSPLRGASHLATAGEQPWPLRVSVYEHASLLERVGQQQRRLLLDTAELRDVDVTTKPTLDPHRQGRCGPRGWSAQVHQEVYV